MMSYYMCTLRQIFLHRETRLHIHTLNVPLFCVERVSCLFLPILEVNSLFNFPQFFSCLTTCNTKMAPPCTVVWWMGGNSMCISTHNYIPTKEGGGTHTSSAPEGARGGTHIRCTRSWRYTHIHIYSYIILHTVYYFIRRCVKKRAVLGAIVYVPETWGSSLRVWYQRLLSLYTDRPVPNHNTSFVATYR